jgi:L-threonylcarbamoyladenylate synthase
MPFFQNPVSPTHLLSALRTGSVIIFPTETLYGIGCNIWDENAAARVFEIKGRAPDQPPPVLIANIKQLDALVTKRSPAALLLMREFWPGSLTLVLPARAELPVALCGFDEAQNMRTIAIRQTAHPLAATVCEALQAPLVATSANFSGATGQAAQPHSLADIPARLQKMADVVIDGGTVGGAPSTIVDCVSEPPRLLRVGAIARAALQKVLPDIQAL